MVELKSAACKVSIDTPSVSPPFALWLKSRFIRTPLQSPLEAVASVRQFKKWLKHPELRGVLREPKEIHRIITKVLSQGDHCIDVGAHLGSVLAQLCKSARGGQHVAIEAVPYKANWLRSRFPEVEVHQVAASDSAGEVEFHENVTRPGFSSMGNSAKASEKVISYRVPCQTLDELVPEDRRIRLIKIDVEGAELLVLQGARRIIDEGQPCIIFESGPNSAKHHGLTDEALYAFLVDSCGYQVFVPSEYLAGSRPLTLEAFVASHQYPFRAFNFVAVPSS